jgi:hypothetical protein
MSSDKLQAEIAKLLNKYSVDAKLETPDYILAEYIMGCLEAYYNAFSKRES